MKRTWMRVIDPGSPLCGWDLLCEPLDLEPEWYEVHGARRLDALLGDRPLQFNPSNGLGMWIEGDRVVESPLQTEGPVEIGTDSDGLYGEHVETREYKHSSEEDGDGLTLQLTVEVFTGAVQVALEFNDMGDEKVVSKTWFGPPSETLIERLGAMMDEGDLDGLMGCIQGGDDGRAQA